MKIILLVVKLQPLIFVEVFFIERYTNKVNLNELILSLYNKKIILVNYFIHFIFFYSDKRRDFFCHFVSSYALNFNT